MNSILLITFLTVISPLAAFASNEEASELLRRFESVQTISSRVASFTGSFLGLPYGKNGPLGEGIIGRYDQDPLFRFDTFDCTTYVETVLALAHANDSVDFSQRMDELRYENGVVGYVTRNHFPSLQWIPNNIRNGYLKEITRDITPQGIVKVASAIIDLPTHYSFMTSEMLRVTGLSNQERTERVLEWQAEGQRLSAQEARLDYVPINWILRNQSWVHNIPNGAVVNFVRPNWDLTQISGTHMNVSHQGFILKRNGKVYLRHASIGTNKVSEIIFVDYLKNLANHPTLKGVHFLAVE